jgi:hypothetical protein
MEREPGTLRNKNSFLNDRLLFFMCLLHFVTLVFYTLITAFSLPIPSLTCFHTIYYYTRAPDANAIANIELFTSAFIAPYLPRPVGVGGRLRSGLVEGETRCFRWTRGLPRVIDGLKNLPERQNGSIYWGSSIS